MADERLRRAERDWRAGDDPQAEAALVRLRLRAGALSHEEAELLAWVGRPGARLALELAADDERLPRRLFRAGEELALATADQVRSVVALRVRTLDDALTLGVELQGALRGAGQAGLGLALDELVAIGASRLVVDVAGLSYIGSTALGGLVAGADALQQRGGRLDLVGVPQNVRVVIEMLGLTAFFGAFCDSTEEALGAGPPSIDHPRAPSDPDRTWLLRLARWGPDPCVRAALALAAPGPRLPTFHPLGSGGLRDPAVVKGDPAAAAAARAWLACPCPTHRAEAGRAAVTVSEGGWPGVAAATAERGVWPHLQQAGPYDRAAVARALAEHLLG